LPPNALNPSDYRFVGHLIVDAAIFEFHAVMAPAARTYEDSPSSPLKRPPSLFRRCFFSSRVFEVVTVMM
jgi:hypothetical protein